MGEVLCGCELLGRLHDGEEVVVHRGVRLSDGLAVVLKVLVESPSYPARLASLRHEHAILTALEGAPGVIGVHGLVEDGPSGQHALLLEDIGGSSLRDLGLAGRISVEEALRLAIAITDALGQVHRRKVIHKDVNPANLILNPADHRSRLIDFGIATALQQQTSGFVEPAGLEGTLAYLSPEQTGRMNRSVDYRTDYYSLGVTLYELFTGQLPFSTHDPLELVHWQIARTPPSPREQVGSIPQPVADIVLRLLAKNADDRYQSTSGLRADLERCLDELVRTQVVAPFTLGEHDVAERFQLPQRIYGREPEVSRLLATFDRVCSGEAALCLVSGRSGVGKSALVQEVYRPLTSRRGIFVAGKLEQYQSGVPYSAVVQALSSLSQHLLTEDEERLAERRAQLRAALDGNLPVLVQAVPSMELVVGPQPAVAELPPADARNRFHQVIRDLLAVFATPEHPLCLFIDDLQWADNDTLKLLEDLLRSGRHQALLLLGAYRDNEVPEAHPLRLTTEQLTKDGVVVEDIALSPLGSAEVVTLLRDAFAVPSESAAPLAEVLLSRTGGNPFFLRAFLTSLHDDGLLERGPQGWRWDVRAIRERGVTDNVGDLLVEGVRRLPPATQQLLREAACLGRRFDVGTLALIAGHACEAVSEALWPAVEQGLVIILDPVHSAAKMVAMGPRVRGRFAHDQVQQALLAMLDADQQIAAHLQLGRALRDRALPEDPARWVFDVTSQLNAGRAAMHDPAELHQLAELNLDAARRALTTAAAQRALEHARAGITALGPEPFARDYALARDLHVAGAEAAFLGAELEQLSELSEAMLAHARSATDEVKVRVIEGQVYYSQQQLAKALATYVAALGRLGIDMPQDPSEEDVAEELQLTAQALGSREIEALLALPVCQDPSDIDALALLNYLVLMTYSLVSRLHPVAICRLVRLSIERGNSPSSAFGYTFYGSQLVYRGDMEGAYRFGRVALALANRFGDKGALSQTYLYATYMLTHWKVPLNELAPTFMEAYRHGVEAGSLFNAACSSTTHCISRFLSGSELGELSNDLVRFREVAITYRQTMVLSWHETYQQAVLNLRGEATDPQRPAVMTGPIYDESVRVPQIDAAGDLPSQFNYRFCKGILCYLLGDPAEALAMAEANAPLAVMFGTSVWAYSLPLWDALFRLAVVEGATDEERTRLLAGVDEARARLQRGQQLCPHECAHKLRLVEAEHARVTGDDATARTAYTEAIELARQSGFLHEEAIACELAARFYLLGRREWPLAQAYMRDAHRAYLRWGAIAKVRRLEREYPHLVPRVATSKLNSVTLTTLGGREFGVLDLIGVLDASQAISQEIRLEQLLVRLMGLLLTLGGAEAGCLLLERNGKWVAEVAKEMDKEAAVLSSVPVGELVASGQRGVAEAVINFVARTRRSVTLEDAAASPQFGRDPHIERHAVRSVLCFPLLRQGDLVGIVYMENNLTSGAFTPDRLRVLEILSAQAVISVQNAVLYDTLEQKVQARTRDLQERNADLADTLQRLREAQQQLIVQEKLAALGALTAGIAHEIRNPLNFVNNFAELSVGLVGDIEDSLREHAATLPERTWMAVSDDLVDLRLNVSKIHEHGKRANGIVSAMIQHSRDGGGRREQADLNAVVAESVALAQHGLTAAGAGDADAPIRVDAHYDGTIGPVWMVAPDISRVLLNLLSNAVDALREKQRGAGPDYVPTLTVITREHGTRAEIRVRDNGIGVAMGVRDKAFQPFFTTKPAGSGVGLGLSISHDIVVGGHQGELTLASEEGEWTELCISLPRESRG